MDRWLRRSFDQAHESSIRNDSRRSGVHDSSEVFQNSKPQSMKPGGKTEHVLQNISSSVSLQHDRLGFPVSEAQHERFNRMRTGNSSMDSGITADVSCTTPSDASWTTVGNTSPDDPRFYPGVQSTYDRSSMHRLSLIEEQRSPRDPSESISIEPQMTPGSQRRPFPRTNPNFVGASFRKTTGGGAVNSGMIDELIPPLNALAGQLSQKPTLLCLSRQAGSAVTRPSRKSDSDDSDLSMSLRRSDKPRTRQLESVLKSNECPDPATARSSFSYHKVTTEDPWLRSSASTNQRSNNSTLSASSGESSTRNIGSGQNPAAGFSNNSAAAIRQLQPSNGKSNESSGVRRVRHNSEPDYANLQDQTTRRDSDDEQGQSNRGFAERSRKAKYVQAKAEPIYANELLTGRGCLTHEDRFHVPLSQGIIPLSLYTTSSFL